MSSIVCTLPWAASVAERVQGRRANGPPRSAQIIKHQIFLATPSDCPLNPDGSKKSGGSGGDRAHTVSLLVSGDMGRVFHEACLPIRYLDKARPRPPSPPVVLP